MIIKKRASITDALFLGLFISKGLEQFASAAGGGCSEQTWRDSGEAAEQVPPPAPKENPVEFRQDFLLYYSLLFIHYSLYIVTGFS